MTLNNVNWNTNESLSGYKLSKMIDNDNYNYTLVNKAPKGLLNSLDIASVNSLNRTLNLTTSDVNGIPTYKLLSTLFIYNKSNIINNRFYKICISDFTINDTNINEATSGVPPHKNYILLFKILHPISLETVLEREWVSNFRPVRSVSTYSPNFWRAQPGEMIISPYYENNFIKDFILEIYVRKRVASHGTFTLTSGNIWVEDAGADI